jgi:cyclopropane fatty-acyl-phospholipid synthase-like methyltransferase
MTEKPCAESAARNAAPILEILKREFRDSRHVLEIGSGTGQHAVTFAAALDHLRWQTSDLDENHTGINAWIEASRLGNVMSPLSMDVRTAKVDAGTYDAVYSANTAHIMGIDAVEYMYSLVGTALRDGGVFCLYGPFRRDGQFNTQSNADFDVDLRGRDPAMGIRDLEVLDRFAEVNGLQRQRCYAVPSNNNVVIWQKTGDRVA